MAPVCAPLRSQAAIIARLPYVQNVGPDRAVVAWTTDQPGQGAVWIASHGDAAKRVTSSVKELLPSDTDLDSPSYRHTAELSGLAPDTEYFYQVIAEAQTLPWSGAFRFRTTGPGPFSFLAFGDSGSGLPQQQMLAEWMKQENPALVLHLGDLAYPQGAFREYQLHYFDVYRDLMKQVPFFPCPGNHGYMTRDGFPYLTLHDVPAADMAPLAERGRYYSFDWGNVHFVAVDSNAPLVQAAQGRGPMLEWLERDLRVTRQYWKIVYFHHPPFAGGPNERDPLSELARNHLVPLAERHGVQLVLNGHEHSYQRSHPLRDKQIVAEGQGTVYVTSGGGGVGLYAVHPNPAVAVGQSAHHYLRVEVNETRLAVHTIGLSGEELDSVNLAPLPEVSHHVEIRYVPDIASSRLVKIYGRNLAATLRSAVGAVFPLELSGISVTANGESLPIRQVSSAHIEAEIPANLSGEVALQLKTPNGSARATVSLSGDASGLHPGRHTLDRLEERRFDASRRARIAAELQDLEGP